MAKNIQAQFIAGMVLNKIQIVVITGPECSGKTTLAQQLAESLNEPWVPEFAREYLTAINRPYVQSDLFEIAMGQLKSIERHIEKSKKWIITDTGPEVIQIWHRDKFGPETTELTALAAAFRPTIYLLCKPDIPYVKDVLREDPERRDELFEKYLDLLRNKNFNIMRGDQSERLLSAITSLREM